MDNKTKILVRKPTDKMERLSKATRRTLFGTKNEAVKFLKKNPDPTMKIGRLHSKCFIVGTPAYIRKEKEGYKQLKNSKFSSSIIIGTYLMAVSTYMFYSAFSDSRNEKYNDILDEFSKSRLKNLPSLKDPKIETDFQVQCDELINHLSSLNYQAFEIKVMSYGEIVVYMWNVKDRITVRDHLDSYTMELSAKFLKTKYKPFDIKVMIYEINSDRSKNFSGNMKVAFGKLNDYISNKEIPEFIKNIYRYVNEFGKHGRLTIHFDKKILPEVGKYLGDLYINMFDKKDYKSWNKKMIDKYISDGNSLLSSIVPDEKDSIDWLKSVIDNLNIWKQNL